MVHSLCQTCFQTYRLMISPSELGLVKQVANEGGTLAPCPRSCGGSINLVGDPGIDSIREKANLRDPLHLTGTELYKAVNGMGLPDELPKNLESIVSLLKANKVADAVVDVDESGHYYLHELHLENNVIVHLTSGLKGAEILKITRRGAHGS